MSERTLERALAHAEEVRAEAPQLRALAGDDCEVFDVVVLADEIERLQQLNPDEVRLVPLKRGSHHPEIPEQYARHLRAGAAPLGIKAEISKPAPREGMRIDRYPPITLDLTVAKAEREVVEAAIQWLKANTAGMTPETWAAVDDDCENKTELLYRAVSALISAKEKAGQSERLNDE